eukprot:7681436-Alexandrium_andersonii.AAC.1
MRDFYKCAEVVERGHQDQAPAPPAPHCTSTVPARGAGHGLEADGERRGGGSIHKQTVGQQGSGDKDGVG